ncbi:hypothetical protein H2202_007319 [Exophiala xenobiotica]|nr:hypothetical protein H2202_007319 [Exophiala xenobiotica]KAK5211857.1 hypothetical protein LTR41_002098 [Exophiala xenobiotica]KAK5226178.1 hypothetical protein LTR72_004082 [Exophiala xenobiotica]KAK5234951.1 hypothetical protein LTR47_003786 [Exophiala xenobiotica]KAK5251953.1 hypothetical protein LTS06_003465 [Exophiala xenobiotica]
MNSSQAPQRGTVADRIRAFQDVQMLESKAPTFNLAPRVLTQAKESGIYEAQGRRESLNFASPAGRASRDGNEGFRGHGRPPVSSVFYKKPRPVKEVVEDEDLVKPLPNRPVTSMGESSNASRIPRRLPESVQAQTLHRRYRSMETMEDPAQEIAAARSRLKSVAEKSANRVSQGDRAYTLAELNIMLDDAIEESGPQVVSDEGTGEITPMPVSLSRSNTSHTVRRQSQSRGPDTRRSIDSVRPRSSEESLRVVYQAEPQTQSPRKPTLPATDKASYATYSSLAVAGRLNRHPEGRNPEPDHERVVPPSQPGKEVSPVKRRAAMFESLNTTPLDHDQVHERADQHKPHQAEHDKHHGAKKTHRITFGETAEERPGTPLIPLVLPTMVSRHQKSDETGSTPRSKPAEQEHLPEAEKESTGDENAQPDKQRKTSLVWPFKWGIFNKMPAAPSQEPEQPSTEEAKPQPHAQTRPSVVRSRVHELMQAASEQEDAAQKRRNYSERERLSRRQTRAPTFLVTESELRENKVDLDQLKPAQVPPLQVSAQEEAEGLKPSIKPEDVPLPRTPLQRAMSEKQVLVPPAVTEEADEGSGSPSKSAPRTPVRGRSRKSVHRGSIGETHGIEHQFKLSPGPSRSVSRSGRGGVKVEVEVRDSPEREARERGERIVIIRADVDAANGED